MAKDDETVRSCTAATFDLACTRDDPWACTMNAMHLSRGIGVPQDLPRALKALDKSCTFGPKDPACTNAIRMRREIEQPSSKRATFSEWANRATIGRLPDPASELLTAKGGWSVKKRCLPLFQALVCIALLAGSPAAHASDMAGLIVFVYIGLVFISSIVIAATWGLTIMVRQRWLRISIRAAVILLFWAPLPSGPPGYWWPLPFALLD